MKKAFLFLTISLFFFFSCETEIVETEGTAIEQQEEILEKSKRKNYFLVANRGSGTVSVFNARTTAFIQDINMPDDNAQPTYLAHSKFNNSIYVGDFANRKVVYFDANSFEIKGEIEIEEGAFHMWINDRAGQLWINNIVSKTTSVIDLRTNSLIENISLPTDEIPELTENAVQHDVTISQSGFAAYVTILDGSDKSYVVMYNTRTLEYMRHEEVGGDAHLLSVSGKIYVPAQNDNKITVFSRFNLRTLDEIPFEATHGVTNSNRFVFTTGISNNKIGVISRFTNNVVSQIDTEFDTPHNLAVNKRGNILFLAHSGASATKVVFYKVRRNGTLKKLSDYDSGINPFGVLEY